MLWSMMQDVEGLEEEEAPASTPRLGKATPSPTAATAGSPSDQSTEHTWRRQKSGSLLSTDIRTSGNQLNISHSQIYYSFLEKLVFRHSIRRRR